MLMALYSWIVGVNTVRKLVNSYNRNWQLVLYSKESSWIEGYYKVASLVFSGLEAEFNGLLVGVIKGTTEGQRRTGPFKNNLV